MTDAGQGDVLAIGDRAGHALEHRGCDQPIALAADDERRRPQIDPFQIVRSNGKPCSSTTALRLPASS